MPFLKSAQLWSFWNRLRSSFWFLPASMAAGAVGLSFVLIEIDGLVGDEVVSRIGWAHRFGPEGARAILSAVAGSMITVAGLTFSITMLTLQLASSQFGPRLLRSFMRDRGNQTVLGTFTSTFIYCLLILRTVRGTEDSSFVPHIAVAFGIVLALASIAVLIFFIHHVATSIRIESILAALTKELVAAIDRVYPEDADSAVSTAQQRDIADGLPGDEEVALGSERGGYIQRVDEDSLLEIAAAADLTVHIRSAPGTFVIAGDPVLSAWPSAKVSGEVRDELMSAIVEGSERTPEQDVEFCLRRIVEIAQRAVSPGINDPTTALYCVDRLCEGLVILARRNVPSEVRFDAQGHRRLIRPIASVDSLAAEALSAVFLYAKDDPDVGARLLWAITRVMDSSKLNTMPHLRHLKEQVQRATPWPLTANSAG